MIQIPETVAECILPIPDYGDFYSSISECTKLSPVISSYSVGDPRFQMNELDQILIRNWISKEGRSKEFDLTRMRSARIAEKVALEFYKQHYPNEKDISITQLSKTAAEWKLYDISLGNEKFVDVKNARTPISIKKRYIEHCVPDFKLNRQGDDVIIAGVLSPYFREGTLRDNSYNNYIGRYNFLGETSKSIISDLEAKFNSNKFEICGIRTNGSQRLKMIPPWIFNYPDWLYENQLQAKLKLKTLNINKYSPEEHWQIKKVNPLPALVYSNCPIPEGWKSISETQRTFITRISNNSDGEITMPILYLSLLTDFIEHISEDSEHSSYSPKNYRRLIFADHNSNPLGLRDSLDLISDLISSLQILWENRAGIQWNSISRYKFFGPGLLVGEFNDGSPITLLAYCGGFIQNKGKCGFSPLISGLHKRCQTCGKLLCPKCGFHSDNCTNPVFKP